MNILVKSSQLAINESPTTLYISLSVAKVLPFKKFSIAQNWWLSLGYRSGEYGRWARTRTFSRLSFAICGRALSAILDVYVQLSQPHVAVVYNRAELWWIDCVPAFPMSFISQQTQNHELLLIEVKFCLSLCSLMLICPASYVYHVRVQTPSYIFSNVFLSVNQNRASWTGAVFYVASMIISGQFTLNPCI